MRPPFLSDILGGMNRNCVILNIFGKIAPGDWLYFR